MDQLTHPRLNIWQDSWRAHSANAALDGQRDGRKHDASGPLFVTRRGVPVGSNWISNRFSKAAIDAGMQKRTSHRVYRIHSH